MRARRARFLVVAVTAVLPIVAGCTRATDGTGQWVPDEASQLVDGDDVADILVDNDDVSAIIDANDIRVVPQGELTTPDPDGKLAECDAMFPPGQRSLAGNYSEFASTTSTDRRGEQITHFALQTAIVYDSVEDATDALGVVGREADRCDGREVKYGDVPWTVSVDESSADRLTWTTTETDIDWDCGGESRARQNVVLRVFTCRGGGKAGEDTQTIADSMSDTVFKLSAPER